MESPGTPSAAQIFSNRRFTEEERRRAARLNAEVVRRKLVRTWVASVLGRSVSTLDQALHARRGAARTLDAVETLLGAIDVGQVRPEVHRA